MTYWVWEKKSEEEKKEKEEVKEDETEGEVAAMEGDSEDPADDKKDDKEIDGTAAAAVPDIIVEETEANLTQGILHFGGLFYFFFWRYW